MVKILIKSLLLLVVIVVTNADIEEDSEDVVEANSIAISSDVDTDSGNNRRSGDPDSTPSSASIADNSTVQGNGSVGGAGHGFYRTMGPRGRWVDTRRVFGGMAARVEDFPQVCALLDRFMGARCSGSLLTPHWALTAAHCISPNLAYVKYNTRHPLRTHDGITVPVRYLYKHPDYKVVQQDVGRGLDVTELHHDMGLVRTRAPMTLTLRSQTPPLQAILAFNAQDLKDEDVQVLGYGRTESTSLGEELLSVRLRLVDCERGAWRHCVCGVSRGGARGVCSGDSGGPVVYRGMQVGVTSMGPLECSSENASWPARATSVFTALFPYADIINRTILEAEQSMPQVEVHSSRAAPLCTPSAVIITVAKLLRFII
ncbi:glandular kallikrein-like [Amyelois transitella]|uniref:glandular kallikrein-like n=1 Tax=Amyelois transitella TaxID=680683 RepID=UPI00067D7E56|nr:glandular kallikrein-like [Amyelois transitella]